MNEIIDRLSAETGVPAPDVERLLLALLGEQIRQIVRGRGRGGGARS
jgi:hypothetical protein